MAIARRGVILNQIFTPSIGLPPFSPPLIRRKSGDPRSVHRWKSNKWLALALEGVKTGACLRLQAGLSPKAHWHDVPRETLFNRCYKLCRQYFAVLKIKNLTIKGIKFAFSMTLLKALDILKKGFRDRWIYRSTTKFICKRRVSLNLVPQCIWVLTSNI